MVQINSNKFLTGYCEQEVILQVGFQGIDITNLVFLLIIT